MNKTSTQELQLDSRDKKTKPLTKRTYGPEMDSRQYRAKLVEILKSVETIPIWK